MRKFEIGKTYYMASPCDTECIWTYTVTKRTPATITITDGKKAKTCRISKHSEMFGEEMVYPLGRYSMCPVLTAEREIVA